MTKHRLKVGIVISRFDPRIGGAESWTYAFANWLLRQGCQVNVLAKSFCAPPTTSHLRYVPLVKTRSRLDLAVQAAAAAKNLSLDVLHDMGVGYAADIIQPHSGLHAAVHQRSLAASSTLWRKTRRWASCWTRRRREMAEILRRQTNQSCSLLVAVSQMVADDFSAFGDFPKHRIRVIHNGVDIPRYKANPIVRSATRSSLCVGDSDVLLLFVGNNFRLKGLATLMQATARLARQHDSVKLCVVGHDRTGAWRRLARQLGIAERVSFHTNEADAAAFYAAADIFVLPSFYDSCSLSLLEAMAAGLPVVTSCTNGAAELLSHGENGFVLESAGDPIELAAQLAPLVGDQSIRQTIASRASHTIQSHSQAENFRGVFALYDEVLESRRTLPEPSHDDQAILLPFPTIASHQPNRRAAA